MKTENLNITVNGDAKEPIELIFREGQAENIIYPKKYSLSGLITAPVEFSKRVKNKALAVVEYSIKNLEIKFLEDPTSDIGAVVTGSVKENPDLIAFGINKDRYFKAAELQKFVLKYAHCFKSLDDAKQLRENLRNFEVKFEQTYKQEDDRKGNSEESVKNAIKYNKGEIRTEWNLSLPLFLGHDNIDLTIQVEIDRDGTTPIFGFYSLELEAKIKTEAIEIIEAQLEQLQDFTCLQLS